ncbi:hypothetical protein AVEN_108406-1 [Araneus ventricosus]|uniref:Uncharacterized protein n=1 Tax=Araneus ventricosus TaxID=182803 RepID=A0A4Y2UBT1_ARAVE|nr:hypothetical protein AVEN_108406-1 [Araneus ventricosus]
MQKFSFETSRGLFLDASRNYEPRSDNEDDIGAGTTSPNFRATLVEGRLSTTYDLTCNRLYTRRIFRGSGLRAWNPLTPKPRPYQ